MRTRIAVLVDGSFFIQRVQAMKRRYFPEHDRLTPEQMVACLKEIVWRHINTGRNSELNYHYRTYFYDAPPLEMDRVHFPLVEPGKKTPAVKHFSKDPSVIFRKAVIEELKKTKKLALRLGTVKADKEWRIKDDVTQQLIKGERRFEHLTNEDFYYSTRQKGVDIKLGIDIATLSIGKQVDRIVLIAGDSDFVPAAKLARTHGVDFVLDAMRNQIEPSLFEHIDGLVNFDTVAILKRVLGVDPTVKPTWWGREEIVPEGSVCGSQKRQSKSKGRYRRGVSRKIAAVNQLKGAAANDIVTDIESVAN